MKILFIAGDHPRHKFVARTIASTGYLSAIISESRGDLIPVTPPDLKASLRDLYEGHFTDRAKCEMKYFHPNAWPENIPLLELPDKASLNSQTVHRLINEEQPDLLLSYGCHKLTNETLSYAPKEKWNIHGGLSPKYKGSITQFWPSYMLEPQYTGMTVHELTHRLDAGAVVHQCTGDLVRGDGLHDLACRTVLKLAKELPELMDCAKNGTVVKKKHTANGKFWSGRDWRPEHLRLIYEFFNNRIVDEYLDGHIIKREPRLHRQFD